MSLHLMLAALEVPIPAGQKVILLALCESASSNTERKAWPGHERLVAVSGLSQRRVFDLLDELIVNEHVWQMKRGQKHQRAEYVVFPWGCCDEHEALSGGRTQPAEKRTQVAVDRHLKRAQVAIQRAQVAVSDRSGGSGLHPFLPTTSTRDPSGVSVPASTHQARRESA